MNRRFCFLVVLVITISLSLGSCSKKQNKISADLIENSTSISFEKDFIDLGKLTSGEIVTCSFKFKNTGKHDLIISAVTANCGCAVADFPRREIPAMTAVVQVPAVIYNLILQMYLLF